MKKLLILLILTFTSCCDVDNSRETMHSIKNTYTEKTYEESTDYKRKQSNLNRIDQALHKVEFSGHLYIIFYNAWLDTSAVFMIHDPDCQCKL